MASRTELASRIAIGAQFAALLRCLGQFFWLQHARGPSLTTVEVQPFISGAFITALFLVVSFILSFKSKHRAIVATAVLNVLALFLLKFWLL